MSSEVDKTNNYYEKRFVFNTGYTPRINYDIACPEVSSEFNVFFNAKYMDLATRPFLGAVNTNIGFNPYSFDSNNFFACKTKFQFTDDFWSDFRANLDFKNIFSGCSNMFGVMPWGNNWGGVKKEEDDDSGKKTGKLTDEESTQIRNFENLLNGLKGLATNSQEEAIKQAIKDAKKKETYADKLAVLKAAFDSFDKQTIKNYFTKAGSGKYFDMLKTIGYDYDDKDSNVTEATINDFRDKINSAKPSDSDGEDTALEPYENNVLEFISKWNSKYANNSSEKNIISYEIAKYNALLNDKDDKDRKTTAESFYNNIVTKTTKGLIDYAEKLAKEVIDPKTEKELRTAISNLDTATKHICLDKLADCFDTLYIIVRKLAAQKIDSEIEEKYGFISDDFKTMILDETKADLKNEKLSEEKINANTVWAQTITTKNPKEAIEQLKAYGYIKKTTLKHNDKEVYQETEKTGKTSDGKVYSKLFVIDGDDIKEITGAYIKDGQIENASGSLVGKRAEDIQSDIVKKQNEKLDKKRYINDVEMAAAKNIAKSFEKNAAKYGSKSSDITEDNVIEVLYQYKQEFKDNLISCSKLSDANRREIIKHIVSFVEARSLKFEDKELQNCIERLKEVSGQEEINKKQCAKDVEQVVNAIRNHYVSEK